MRVIPITGTNAGPMTGRGTNAYLLPGGHPTLIDAPEASDAFVDRVAEALDTEQPGTPLSQVLITHFHHDHIDGVEALAKRWPDLRIAKFPFPEQDAKHNVTWTPLHDGQLVAAGDGTLWVLHTPGHAPDHVAFLEMRSSILFCGDLLVNGGTVAIAPSKGGDLAALPEVAAPPARGSAAPHLSGPRAAGGQPGRPHPRLHHASPRARDADPRRAGQGAGAPRTS